MTAKLWERPTDHRGQGLVSFLPPGERRSTRLPKQQAVRVAIVGTWTPRRREQAHLAYKGDRSWNFSGGRKGASEAVQAAQVDGNAGL